MSKERAAKVMQEIFSKGTYEGDLLGIHEGRKMSNTPRTDAAVHPTQLLRRADGTSVEIVNAVTCRQLERELAEAKMEAERYRWLRDNSYNVQIGVYELVNRDGRQQRAWLAGNELDDVIDAAMKEGEK